MDSFQGARSGGLDEAVTHFRRAVRLKPADAELHFNLGHALGVQGRLDQAIHHMSEALRINPDLTGARTRLEQFLETKHEDGQ